MKRIGRYDIVEEVGRGAMGVVFKASDPTIGRLVAIKVLALPLAGEEGVAGARDIFIREARAAGRLSHPGIVTIHDALADPETQQDYIVMEFIQGQTLEKILLKGPALTVEKACEIIKQAAEALEYAHSQEIVHRDLKPANILLNDQGRVKITDFGIAKLAAQERTIQTVGIVGTPAYMSPEQVSGQPIDARSDLFSLGVVFYVMLTGEKPFVGDTAAAMFKIVYEDPVLPSQIKTELGPGYDYLILRSLAKDRDKRYSSAREFLDDLEDVRQGRAPRSESKVPFSELRAGDRTLIGPHTPFAEGRAPRGKWSRIPAQAWAGIGAAGAVLLVLLGWGLLKFAWHKIPPPTAARLPVPATSQTAPLPPSMAPIAPASASSEKAAMPPAGSAPSSARPAKKIQPKSTVKKRPATTEAPGAAANTTPVSPAVAKAPVARPAQSTPAPASVGNAIQFDCTYELKDGTLTISNESQVLLRRALKGKRKGKFLGIKSSYEGAVSQPITIPAGSKVLSVEVVSEDGAIDLTGEIALSSAGASRTLHADVKSDQIALHWGEQTSPLP